MGGEDGTDKRLGMELQTRGLKKRRMAPECNQSWRIDLPSSLHGCTNTLSPNVDIDFGVHRHISPRSSQKTKQTVTLLNIAVVPLMYTANFATVYEY